MALWECAPAIMEAAEGLIAASTPSVPPMTPALAGMGSTGASTAVTQTVAANAAKAAVGAAGLMLVTNVTAKRISTSRHPEFQSNMDSESANKPNGTYEDSPKHGDSTRDKAKGDISPKPTDGQKALDRSIQVKPTSPRRVGVDPEHDQIVVLDRTQEGLYQGHVRKWDALSDQMKNALVDSELTDSRGAIIKP